MHLTECTQSWIKSAEFMNGGEPTAEPQQSDAFEIQSIELNPAAECKVKLN